MLDALKKFIKEAENKANAKYKQDSLNPRIVQITEDGRNANKHTKANPSTLDFGLSFKNFCWI